jgi:hypothetical protein
MKKMSQSGADSGQSGVAGTYGSGTGRFPRRGLLGIILAVILLLLLLLLLFFFPRPTATVTLTPMSRVLNDTIAVKLITHSVNAAQQDTQTGVPSGPPALGTHATGVLTFWNYTSSWVTIAAGTTVTNATGQQVATDKELRVPPDPIIPGVASVSAHAVKVGKSGNIAAMSINKACCFTGIVVANEALYSGGSDAQTLPIVRQSDLDTVANALKTALTQKVLTYIRSQLKTGEQLVSSEPQCNTKITALPAVGTSAAKFSVTVALACTDAAFNAQDAVQQAQDRLKQEATQQLAPGFALVGTITATIQKVLLGEPVTVLVAARGVWRYHFTAALKRAMAQRIVRKTVSNAKTLLLQQTGVADVAISVRGPIIDLGGGKVITDDVRAITING